VPIKIHERIGIYDLSPELENMWIKQ
jgi:hypothetical protein